MADNIKRTILVELGLQKSKFTADAVDSKKQISDLTAAQKELKKAGEENSAQFVENETELKRLKKEYSDAQRAASNFEAAVVASNNEASGSMEQLRAELSVLKLSIGELSEDERNSDFGKSLSAAIVSVTEKLNEEEQKLLDFHRNVGNYPKVNVDEIKKISDELRKLSEESGKANAGAPGFEDASKRVKELQSNLDELLSSEKLNTGSIREMQLAISSLKEVKLDATGAELKKINDAILQLETNVLQAEGKIDEFGNKEPKNKLKKNYDDLNDVLQASVAIVGALSLAGVDEARVSEIQRRVAIAQTIAINAKSIAKAGIIALEQAEAIKIKTGIALQTAYTFVIGGSTGALKLFRLALAGTGIGLIIIALAELILNFDKVKNAVLEFVGVTPQVKKTQEQINEMNEAQKELNETFLNDHDKKIVAIKKQAAEYYKAGLSVVEIGKFVLNEQKKLSKEEEKVAKEKADKLAKEEKAKNDKIVEARKKLTDDLDKAEYELNNANKAAYDVAVANVNHKYDELEKRALKNKDALKRIEDLRTKELQVLEDNNNKKILDQQNQLSILQLEGRLKTAEENFEKEYEIKQQLIEKNRAQELSQLNLTEEEKALIIEKYRQQEVEVNTQYEDARINDVTTRTQNEIDLKQRLTEQTEAFEQRKRDAISGTASAIASFFGKNTLIYKTAFGIEKAITLQTIILQREKALAANRASEQLRKLAVSGIPLIGPFLAAGIGIQARSERVLINLEFIGSAAAIAGSTIAGFKKGGVYKSDGKGGLLPGYALHDSINARLRHGEGIVVSEAMQNAHARKIVSDINVAYGGRAFDNTPKSSFAFADGGMFDGGYSYNYRTPAVNAAEIGDAVASALIDNFPTIVVPVRDIITETDKVLSVEGSTDLE